MKKYLEYTDVRSNKFWEIELKGKMINICYGRIGIKNPATQKKSFPSNEFCYMKSKKTFNNNVVFLKFMKNK